MARLSGLEPTQQRASDLTAMEFLTVHQVNNYYKSHKQGFEVNDGKYITLIDDGKGDY